MARRKRKTASANVLHGHEVPPELWNPGHSVWHDRNLYVAWCRGHDFSMSIRERMGCADSPRSRHRHAVGAWATRVGIRRAELPNWGELRRVGLLPSSRECSRCRKVLAERLFAEGSEACRGCVGE